MWCHLQRVSKKAAMVLDPNAVSTSPLECFPKSGTTNMESEQGVLKDREPVSSITTWAGG